MILAIVLASIIGYLFIGGLVGHYMYATRTRRCQNCAQRGYCYADHQIASALTGMLWIGAIWMFGGAWLAHYFTSSESRAAKKAAREKVRHERRMAEIEAEKQRDEIAIEFLERNGVKARVEV